MHTAVLRPDGGAAVLPPFWVKYNAAPPATAAPTAPKARFANMFQPGSSGSASAIYNARDQLAQSARQMRVATTTAQGRLVPTLAPWSAGGSTVAVHGGTDTRTFLGKLASEKLCSDP